MLCVLQRQPFKAFYIGLQLIATIGVRIPFWCVYYIPKSNRPRPSWPWLRCIRVNLLRLFSPVGAISARVGTLIPHPTHRAIPKERHIKSLWIEPVVNELITGQLEYWAQKAWQMKAVSIPGYWQDKPGFDTPIGEVPASVGEKVIYYLHGGAYVSHSAHPSDILSRFAAKLIDTPGYKRVFTVEYRLTSGSPLAEDTGEPFPAALIDALSGYSYLVNIVGFDPKDIVIGGDSAGSNLALALTRYLVECHTKPELRHIPAPPGGLLLISPWTDLGISHMAFDAFMTDNLSSDFLPALHNGIMFWARRNYCGVHGFTTAGNFNPYISPSSILLNRDGGSVSFEGFPRTFIIAGDAEIFIDQIRMLKRQMTGDLGEDAVVYHEERDAIHDFIVFDWYQPEANNALRDVRNWLSHL